MTFPSNTRGILGQSLVCFQIPAYTLFTTTLPLRSTPHTVQYEAKLPPSTNKIHPPVLTTATNSLYTLHTHLLGADRQKPKIAVEVWGCCLTKLMWCCRPASLTTRVWLLYSLSRKMLVPHFKVGNGFYLLMFFNKLYNDYHTL